MPVILDRGGTCLWRHVASLDCGNHRRFCTLISTAEVAVIVAIWATLYAQPTPAGRRFRPPPWTERPVQQLDQAWLSMLDPTSYRQFPVIITFVLRGAGRLDVPTSVFDNSTPITVSVTGAEIRRVLQVGTRRGGGLAPPSEVRDNKLEIGPGLIGKNQILTYTLAGVDLTGTIPPGRVPATLTNALIDTKLRTYRRDALIRRGVVGAIIVVLFVAGFWLDRISSHRTQNLISFAAVGVSLLGTLVGALVARPRRPKPLQAENQAGAENQPDDKNHPKATAQ